MILIMLTNMNSPHCTVLTKRLRVRNLILTTTYFYLYLRKQQLREVKKPTPNHTACKGQSHNLKPGGLAPGCALHHYTVLPRCEWRSGGGRGRTVRGQSLREAGGKGQEDHPIGITQIWLRRLNPGTMGSHTLPSSPLALLRGLCPQRCDTPTARVSGQAGPASITQQWPWGLPTWCTQTLHLSQKTISLPSSPSGERHTSQTTSSSYSMPSPSCVSMARAMFWWHSVSSASSTRSSVSSSSSGFSARIAGQGVRGPASRSSRTGAFLPARCVYCLQPQFRRLNTDWARLCKGPGGLVWCCDFRPCW